MKNRATLEVIAASIEEAVANGLSELGLSEDEIEVEVLDSGSRGLFGLGSRQARVRLTVKSMKDQAAQQVQATVNPEPAPQKTAPEHQMEDVVMEEQEDEPEQASLQTTEIEEQPEKKAQLKDEQILWIARETVADLLEKMKIHADIDVYYGEPDDSRSKTPICVDITGKDLSILIGRQAETLNALQYISSLIVGKELGYSIPLVVDVENYRKRRDHQLRQMARRMADQAVKTGRRQVLEPMPANERRIIHIELRENDAVTTESIGEEPRRKVTISPK